MTHGDSAQGGHGKPIALRPLLIASTLCWVCVLFAALTALAYGADILTHAYWDWIELVYVGAGLVFAATYCIAGYTLRQGRRLGAWFAIATAVVVSGALTVEQQFDLNAPATIVLVVNLFLIGLVLANWRALSSTSVGA